MDADLADGAPLGGAASSASRRRLVDAAGAGPVPTRLAEASRALAGNTSTSEQYAFAGMACVIDRHAIVADSADADKLHSNSTKLSIGTLIRFANNDSCRLAIGAIDGGVSVSLVSPDGSQLLQDFAGHRQSISSLAWSSDNCLLLTASVDGTAKVWRLEDNNKTKCQVVDHYEDYCLRQFPTTATEEITLPPIFAAEFAPSNNNLFVVGGACAGGRGQLRSVNLSTGLCQASLRLPATVTCLTFGCESVADPGGQLWLGDSAGTLLRCRLDPANGRLTRLAAYHCSNGTALPALIDDGIFSGVGGHSRAANSGPPIASLQARSWLSREARDPCLLVCAANSEVLLYYLESGCNLVESTSTRIESNDLSNSASSNPSRPVLRRRIPIPSPSRAAFCPLMSFRPGACIVCASSDGCVYICDIARLIRPIVNQLQGHAAPVTDVAFNYDESLLASADSDGLVIVWRRA